MWGSQGWNQWALQPAMFNDVPHEQIDWAALAKQWIQMQQTQPPDTSAPPVLPPVPPPAVSAPPLLHPPPPGHGPMGPEEYSSDIPVNAPIMKPPMGPIGVPEPFPKDRSFESEPNKYKKSGFIQKPINNAYWNKSHWEPSAPGGDDDRLWPAPPPPPPPIEPAAGLISGKETYDYGHMHDNPPLAMQSIDYNHMSEYSYNQPYPPETPYDQYWSQVNAAPPPIAPMFLKKEHNTITSNSTSSSLPVEEETSQIDAAKRKQLPAWIREGLEKMEQERIRKIEKEKAEKEKAEKLAKAKLNSEIELKDDVSNPVLVKSKFDSDSDADAEEDNVSISKQVEVHKRSPSPIEDFRTEEEKRQEYMLQLRRILTEILLSVTNAEMYSIAEETLKKEKLKARQLASTASLTSVASGLRSLANYGTESEASEVDDDKDASDSDEELYRRIREKKKTFAIKQKKILAELEKKELEEQNEALKLKNENKFANNEFEDVEDDKEPVNTSLKEENETAAFLPPSDIVNPNSTNLVPFDEKEDTATEIATNTNSDKDIKKSNDKDSHSSDSSSSSSESESESGDKHKKKSSKIESEKNSSKSKKYKKDKSPSRKHRHRSSDSDSSDRHHKSRKSSYTESSRKSSSYKKKKKYKRSDSSSSSSSSPRKKKYSSESKRRDQRSHSRESRKHKRSVSPKNYRSSRDSHRSRDSYSHRHEKEKYLKREKEDKYYEYKRSPSPYKRSKLPKKYRSSRSPSSENESSKKYKRTRAR